MNKLLYLALLLVCSCGPSTSGDSSSAVPSDSTMTEKAAPAPAQRAAYALAIHGGAGTIERESLTPEMEKDILAALNAALDIGEQILRDGGTALDAVTQTVISLENAPYFNAGKGSVFTSDGRNELDASIMDGKTMNAGAVGGVTTLKNPILAARAVMENSRHVMLSGAGAEEFARTQGLEEVDPSYFYTEHRWKALQEAKEKEARTGMVDPNPDHKFGTVGCAALDRDGNLAAGTSTGGMTNKRWNRIGDAPIIGAGTYANNNTCATSSTGHGEYYIRYVVAHDISAMVEYKGLPFPEAARYAIEEKLRNNGGSGGLIGVDKYGNVAMPFNTPGMYRGYVRPGEREVKIFDD